MRRGTTDVSLSRRRLLTMVGAGGAALAGGPVLAVGQENTSSGDRNISDRRITTPGIIPATGRINATEDYVGFFLYLTKRLEYPGDTNVEGLRNCTTADWSVSNPQIFEVQLIDKAGNETGVIGSTVYLPQDVQTSVGQLFIINNQQRCGEAYISIQIEETRRRPEASTSV